MKDKLKQLTRGMGRRVRQPWVYIKSIIKWVIYSSIAGVICGLVGTAFHICVNLATDTFSAHFELLYLLPLSGCLIVFIYHLNGVYKDEGTDLVMTAVRSREEVPGNMTFLIFAGTVLTQLFGGSGGREGAALQIGGSVGSVLGKILRLDANERRIIITCGMSALFSALFGTPLAAAIFSMEVVSVGVMNYAAFLPCIVSSMIAVRIAGMFGIEPMGWTIDSIPAIGFKNALIVGVFAVMASIVAMVFIFALKRSGMYFKKYIENPYLRVICGAAVVIIMTFIVGDTTYNCAGIDIVDKAFVTTVPVYAFAVKILFTAVTIGSGFKGGEIIPSFFIGATLGNAFAYFTGMEPTFMTALGMICVFCSVVNCPMASVIMSVELFGSGGILYFALGCAVCFIASGYYSLYGSQDFVYSKIPINPGDKSDINMGLQAKKWKEMYWRQYRERKNKDE